MKLSTTPTSSLKGTRKITIQQKLFTLANKSTLRLQIGRETKTMTLGSRKQRNMEKSTIKEKQTTMLLPWFINLLTIVKCMTNISPNQWGGGGRNLRPITRTSAWRNITTRTSCWRRKRRGFIFREVRISWWGTGRARGRGMQWGGSRLASCRSCWWRGTTGGSRSR